MFSTFLPALIWLHFCGQKEKALEAFDGLSFASVFIILIGHFDAVLKCIVEITDRAAAPLTIQLQWVVDIGSMLMLQ